MTITFTNIVIQILISYSLVAWYLYSKGEKSDQWKQSLIINSTIVVTCFLSMFGLIGFLAGFGVSVLLIASLMLMELKDALVFLIVLYILEAITYGFISVLF